MKLKTYVLIVSEKFPGTHIKSGLPTDFVNSISEQLKIHTIRTNYDLWKQRINEINLGKAVLSVRVWTGLPYKSKQKEVFSFDEVGIEKLQGKFMQGWFIDDKESLLKNKRLAENDGLSREDFVEWFKNVGQDTEPMAIIHFSKFRYGN